MSCRVRFAFALAVLGVPAVISPACKESTGPSSGGNGPLGVGVTVIAGGTQRDTANAILVQALVLRITDSTGRPATEEVVRFQSVPADSQPGTPSTLVGSLTSQSFWTFATATTDDSGEAAILVQLGPIAGIGRVAVSVPRFAYQDTASFAILPGAAVRLGGLRDTALYVGHTGPLHAFVADQNGNRRPEAVTYQSLNPSVATVTGAGAATAVAVGRATIIVRCATPSLTDSTHVGVVPPGTLAALVGTFGTSYGTLLTLNLDGSGITAIPQSSGDNMYLQWAPDGGSILLFRPSYGGHLYSMSLAGALTRLVPLSAGFAEDNWARYAANGTYIFFRGVRTGCGGCIYRIQPDGTGLDSVPVGSGTQPSPSPDGRGVAYTGWDGQLHVYNYVTATDTSYAINAYGAHWSPDGNWIAYTTSDVSQIHIVRPDGSGAQAVSAGSSYGWSFDWSPDSKWLVASNLSTQTLTLIQVQTGLELPLGYTAGLTQPTWKP